MATPKLRLVTTSKKLSTTEYKTLPIGIHLPNGRYVATGARIIMQSQTDGLSSVGQKLSYMTRRSNLFKDTDLCILTTEQKKTDKKFYSSLENNRLLVRHRFHPGKNKLTNNQNSYFFPLLVHFTLGRKTNQGETAFLFS